MTISELDTREAWSTNHPSFDLLHGLERSPAWDLLEAQVNDGFAVLFADALKATDYLGCKCHPAPLGTW